MPPLSSPVPRLSSAPSDVYTVHTIASRSPPHPLATSHRVREGRPPRPVQGDAIATPRHHIASEQQPQGIASTFCHPHRLFLVLVLFLHVVMVWHSKRANEKKRENQGEGCRRHPRQFLASLLLRLMSLPSTPSPAAHHFARLCQRSGRWTGGHLVRFWSMSSPRLATTSPANSSKRASPRRSAILPASFNSSSILQVVREGQRASQGGPPLPAHPVYPLHPAGEDRHRPASHFWRFGEHIPQTRTN